MNVQQKMLYNKNGWLNPEPLFSDEAPFVVACGGRGIGKTFNVLDYLIRNDIKFIYLRRTQEQINAIKTPVLSPFNALNLKLGYHIGVGSLSKNTVGFYQQELDENGEYKNAGSPLGVGVALSTIASIRGIDGSLFDVILFDEFIAEKHERPIKAEQEAFLNAYETFNRNREVDGGKPLKCILLSNSNDLNSAILKAIGAREKLDNMIRKNISYCNYGALSIYRYIDSPISEKKRKTALYTLTNNTDFVGMALNNQFSAANYEYVGNRPINEYKPIVSIGDMTIYEHKSNEEYYIVPGIKSKTRYTTLPNDIRSFRRHYWYLYQALLNRSIRFATASVKLDFDEIWR